MGASDIARQPPTASSVGRSTTIAARKSLALTNDAAGLLAVGGCCGKAVAGIRGAYGSSSGPLVPITASNGVFESGVCGAMILTIQHKLVGGFGLLLVLLVGSLVLSLSTMSGLNGHAHQLGTRDLQAASALGNVRTGIMTMRAAAGDNLQAPNASVKKITADAVTSSRAAVIAGLRVYGQNLADRADGSAFAVVRQEAEAIIAGSDKTMGLSAGGEVRQAPILQ